MFVRFMKWLHDSGAIKKWFAWVEGLTLAALFLATGKVTGSLPVLLLGAFSVFLLYVSATYTVSEIAGPYLTKMVRKKAGVVAVMSAVLAIASGVLIILYTSIVALLKHV